MQLNSIAQDLNGVAASTWVPNCMVLVQAVFCNVLSSASDLFQARKTLLVVCTAIAFVGAAIAPGSQSIGRLIAAQTLIGFSIAVIPLTFAVPSEILPTRWRPSRCLTSLWWRQ
jgi:MFS family permease